MPDSNEAKASFFPGVRKEIFVLGCNPLKTKADERRIKVHCSMSLKDGKLIGMPEWIGAFYEKLQKTALGGQKVGSGVSMDGMTVKLFATDQQPADSPTLLLDNCLLNAFKLQRNPEDKSDGEVADIQLHFCLYIAFNVKLWKWLGDHFLCTCYADFDSSQASFTFEKGKGKEDAEGDEEEAQGTLIDATGSPDLSFANGFEAEVANRRGTRSSSATAH